MIGNEQPHATTYDPVIGRWLGASIFEITPVWGMDAAVEALPRGARVHVTRSPAQRLAKSLDAACGVARKRPDLTVVPHIAARRVEDRRHLARILHALAGAGINDAFVVAGDSTDVAAGYIDGLGLIRDIRVLAPDFGRIGIPGYPDGHPFIASDALTCALQDKARYADFISTQMCFSAPVIATWLRAVRAAGIELPVYVGVPGIVNRLRLLKTAMHIGVGQSTRFLSKSGELAGNLLGSSVYRPDEIIEAMRRVLATERLDITGLHINTFNQMQATEAWRQSWLRPL